MKSFLHLLTLLIGLFCYTVEVTAQTDTEFWFVAPEADAGHGDNPIYFRFSTLTQAATVTISQPANPAFVPQTVTLTANSTSSVNLTTQLSQVENKPPNVVLNKGILIQSTTPITAYYEIANTNNPEIFPLKGQNALGTNFYVTAQDDYPNQVGKAAIDIVATEDNTVITITPKENVLGHTANIPFTITLNRGETFSAESLNTGAAFSLAGSHITSNKPIAVTVSDDSIFAGGSFDIIGDQLVPVSLVGTEYIAVRGNSNAEYIYIVATENNTDIMLNGNPTAVATINAGDKYKTTVTAQALYIQTSKPVYVMHLSGFGNEFGDALLPPINCTGSTEVGFIRTTPQSFSMLVLTETGNQANFTVNGNGSILTGADFTAVPGTGNAWQFALKSMNTAQVGVGGNRIKNTTGLFHLGILNNVGASAEYGYFSNYSSLFLGADVEACQGDVVELVVGTNLNNVLWSTGETDTVIQVTQSGTYWVSANLFNCTLADTVVVDFIEIEADLGVDTSVCIGTGVALDAFQPLMTYSWQDGSINSTFTANGIGTYWVEITDTLGCTDRDSIIITNYPTTQVDLGADQFFPCDSTQYTIAPNYTTGTFVWQDGSTNSNFIANGVGQYWVDYQDVNTCPSTDTVELIMPTPPTVFIGNDTTLCVGDSIVLDATIPNNRSYIWQDGSTNSTFTVLVAGTYSVTATDNLGCQVVDAIQVSYMQPTVQLRSDTTICFDSNITLDATQTGMTYLWSNGATTPTITVNPDTSYWVQITDAFTCTDRDTFELTHYSVADLGTDIVFVCDSLFVPLEPGITQGTFLWQDGSTNPTFNPPGQGTYWVAITDLNGCFSTDTVSLIPVTSPNVEIGLDTNICFGNTVHIDATTPFIRTYIWQDSSDIAIYPATVTNLYTVEVIDSNGCSGYDTMMVWVNEINPNIGEDTAICNNNNLMLDATLPQMTYLWQDGSTNATFMADTGLFHVQLTDTLGCMESDSIYITYRPNADLGPDIPYICDSLFVTLNPNIPNGTYLWSDSSVDSILQSNIEGTYWVNVIDEKGCVSSDTIIVTQISHPQVFLGNDTIICIGESVVLDADIGNVRSYLWQDGSTNSTFTVTTTGTYHVEVTDNNGCQDFDTIFIQVNEVMVDLGNDTLICTYDNISFNVSQPLMTYLWQDGITTPTYTAQAVGDYHVLLTDTIGCQGSDTMTITHAPEIDLGEDRLFKCDSNEVTIIPNLTMGTFLWQDGTTDRIYVTPNFGTYGVVFTDVYNCVSRDTIELIEPPIPPLDLGEDRTLCFGNTYTLNAFDGTGRSYLWQDGSTNSDFIVTESGTYHVEITDTNGCVNADTILLEYFLPSLLNLGNDTTICENTTLLLDATTPNVVRYTWQDGTTTTTFTASQAGTYSVEIEDVNQCILTDTIEMDILLEPRPVSLPNDTTVCNHNLVRLNAYEPNATHYEWIGESAFFGQNDPNDTTFIVTFPGQYQVSINNRCAEVSQFIHVIHNDCTCHPYIPNAFTPNDDGTNDFFQVYNTCLIENFQMRIFDRWGTLLFESTDPAEQWDGTLRGQAVETGVYVWQVQYDSTDETGQVVNSYRTGDVTVLK